MQYKGEAKSVTEIGRELKVGTVLEGSVRKAGNKLRITVQLIDAMTQEPLWSQDYDRELKDVFAIQSDIAQRVANALKVQLVTEEKKQIEKEATENLEAYTFYLKGRYFWNQRTEASFRKAIEYYERAIASDPNYALAYAGMADSYNMLGNWGLLLPKEAYPEAKKAARKALEIDETLAQAQVALSFARFLYDWDFSAGLSGFQQALEMNPNYAPGHQWYGISLQAMGRMEEAISEVKRAQELDPLSLIINAVLGRMLYIAREYDQAIDQCLKTLEMNPDFHPAHLYMGYAYLQKGMYDEAIMAFQEAVRSSGGTALSKARLGQAYANAGKKRKAFRILDELEEKAKSEYVSPLYIARIYTALGEKDMAFEWLERAYEIRFPWMVRLAVEPGWDPLRSDPRFTVLLKKMGLESDRP